MLRSILVVLFIAIFFLFSIPLFAVEWIIGKVSPRVKDASLMKIMHGAIRTVLFLSGVRITLKGREYIASDQAVLYIANHRSLFDFLVTCLYFQMPVGYLAKIQLKKVPVLGMWLSSMHGFFLDRNDIRQGLKTILSAIDTVKAGTSVIVFPEGTRGRSEDMTELLPFHAGSFKIAQKSGCPIVPIAITNTSAILEDHFPRIRSAHVIVEFGSPIDPASLTGEDKKHMDQYVGNILHEMLLRNSRQLKNES